MPSFTFVLLGIMLGQFLGQSLGHGHVDVPASLASFCLTVDIIRLWNATH